MVNNYRIKALSDHLICSLEGKSIFKKTFKQAFKNYVHFWPEFVFFFCIFSVLPVCSWRAQLKRRICREEWLWFFADVLWQLWSELRRCRLTCCLQLKHTHTRILGGGFKHSLLYPCRSWNHFNPQQLGAANGGHLAHAKCGFSFHLYN